MRNIQNEIENIRKRSLETYDRFASIIICVDEKKIKIFYLEVNSILNNVWEERNKGNNQRRVAAWKEIHNLRNILSSLPVIFPDLLTRKWISEHKKCTTDTATRLFSKKEEPVPESN